MGKLKVFSAPEHIKEPVFSFDDVPASQKDEERYLNEIEEFCTSQYKGKYIGKVAKFPVADGYALYMVCRESPMELIHLQVGDAWDYQHVDYLPAKEIKQNIDSQERMAKLFS